MLNTKKLFTKVLATLKNVPQFRYGTVAGSSVSANSYLDVSVNFSSAMKGTPVVYTTLMSSSTSPAMGSFMVSPLTASSSGFTCRVFNNTDAARTPAIYYIALYGGGQ